MLTPDLSTNGKIMVWVCKIMLMWQNKNFGKYMITKLLVITYHLCSTCTCKIFQRLGKLLVNWIPFTKFANILPSNIRYFACSFTMV